ncbi:MAG: glycosyltransferase [Bacillota bacterium]|nr:glycosyltransferase [Bacillota bacterium]
MIPSVSIIIPIYNVEKLLRRCIDSVLEQTLANIEIILVEDGSPDNCSDICDEYKKKDTRIKVIHKKNGGLSSARNAGVKIATGEYIGFVDSDDWIEKDMYQKLFEAAASTNSDIVKCGFNVLQNNKIINSVIPELPKGIYEQKEIMNKLFPGTISPQYLFSNKNKHVIASAWSHIYKKEFYDNNNLTFISEKEILSEDFVFNFQAYLKANRISIIEDKLYNYDIRIDSLSHCYRTDLYKRKLNFYNCFYRCLSENKLIDKYEDRLDYQYISNMFECLINECYAANKIKLSHKIKNMNNILSDNHLKELLIKCSTKDMHLKGKIIIFLMKNRYSLLFFIIYKLQRIFKKINV